MTEACTERAAALYSGAVDTVHSVSSPEAAELTKLLENIFRSVNIALVNELAQLCERMKIDVWEVVDAAATKPFGFMSFKPGPGLGGHCIPIDPFYLTWKARAYGVHTRFIELAGEINAAMPVWVLGKVTDALNARGKSVRGSRILVLGVAYKKNVDDLRESPALELMKLLAEKGARVAFSDPHVAALRWSVHDGVPVKGVELTGARLAEQDLVLLATDHDAFDYELILKRSPLIVDTRGRYLEPAANVVKA
jgi:UDP-N-acetyl-D-glucosamine dehydrogenase